MKVLKTKISEIHKKIPKKNRKTTVKQEVARITFFFLIFAGVLAILMMYGNFEVLRNQFVPQEKTTEYEQLEEEPAEFTQVIENLTPTIIEVPANNSSQTPEEWGVAKQIDEHTWTIKVGEDARMATPQEILTALNEYRQRHGSNTLQWDDKLAEYAQGRADHFNSIKSTDKHAGFNDYVQNQNGFEKLGFNGLGENSSYGYKVEAVHLIEWIYAADEPHNKNQLNSGWSHVGIGVSGTSTNLIFGGKKG